MLLVLFISLDFRKQSVHSLRNKTASSIEELSIPGLSDLEFCIYVIIQHICVIYSYVCSGLPWASGVTWRFLALLLLPMSDVLLGGLFCLC